MNRRAAPTGAALLMFGGRLLIAYRKQASLRQDAGFLSRTVKVGTQDRENIDQMIVTAEFR